MIAAYRGSVTDVPCSDCGAAVGEPCSRHRRASVASLLACPVRSLDSMAAQLVPCPAGELVGAPHSFRAGSGVVVPWSVMGDGRGVVTVCPSCAVNSVINDGTLDG
jgi:hypothetical protein